MATGHFATLTVKYPGYFIPSLDHLHAKYAGCVCTLQQNKF